MPVRPPLHARTDRQPRHIPHNDREGPRVREALPEAASSQLFALFEHARYCPGEHASKKHREICTAAKFVMLHVRDCAGKLPNGADCPFSWCGPCRASVAKHHLPPVGSG